MYTKIYTRKRLHQHEKLVNEAKQLVPKHSDDLFRVATCIA